MREEIWRGKQTGGNQGGSHFESGESIGLPITGKHVAEDHFRHDAELRQQQDDQPSVARDCGSWR